MNTVSKIEELNIDGFQIVRADMFAHMPRKSDSTCSLWPTKISFSKLCLEQLNNCEFIRIEVNPKTKYLLLVPVTSQDKDSIRWVKGAKMQYIRNRSPPNEHPVFQYQKSYIRNPYNFLKYHSRHPAKARLKFLSLQRPNLRSISNHSP